MENCWIKFQSHTHTSISQRLIVSVENDPTAWHPGTKKSGTVNHTDSGSKGFELRGSKRFGEDVGEHVVSANFDHLEVAGTDLLVHPKVSKSDVLGSGLHASGGRNDQGSSVVLTDLKRLVDQVKVQVKFSKNLSQPDSLFHGFTQGVEFSFTGTQGHQPSADGLSSKRLLHCA